MHLAYCTLFEGDYHLGGAALANSLHAAGARGELFAGYRGALPPWAAASIEEKPGRHRLILSPEFSVVLVRLETSAHFAFYKPEWLERILDELAPGADAAVYLDPDIVVKCPASALEDWVDDGVALCEDINPSLPARHPTRRLWERVLTGRGVATRRALERYYNSGFVGVPRAHRALMAEWRRMMALVRDVVGAQHHHIKAGDANSLFHTPDQDALNLALMTTDTPLNTAGPEAMDFAVGGHHLSHAVGLPKPWHRGYVRHALRGYPPSAAVKNFHLHLSGPIPVFPVGEIRQRRRALALAALIGRFYRRA